MICEPAPLKQHTGQIPVLAHFSSSKDQTRWQIATGSSLSRSLSLSLFLSILSLYSQVVAAERVRERQTRRVRETERDTEKERERRTEKERETEREYVWCAGVSLPSLSCYSSVTDSITFKSWEHESAGCCHCHSSMCHRHTEREREYMCACVRDSERVCMWESLSERER